jgi:hypothetical protein
LYCERGTSTQFTRPVAASRIGRRSGTGSKCTPSSEASTSGGVAAEAGRAPALLPSAGPLPVRAASRPAACAAASQAVGLLDTCVAAPGAARACAGAAGGSAAVPDCAPAPSRTTAKAKRLQDLARMFACGMNI